MNGFRRILIGCLLALTLAACGGAGTAGPDDGWVVLDNLNLDMDDITLSGGDQAEVAPVELAPAEAEARLPFELVLPAWVPDGFTALDLVEVVAPQDAQPGDYASVIVTWEDADGAQVQLQVSANAADAGGAEFGAAGTSETVSVNGDEATLVEKRGLGPTRLTLSWGRAGLDYRLTADGGALERADLVRMAESIP